jgi:hypothetical protein
LLEDEEIIVKTTSLLTLFKVIHARNRPVIDDQVMAKIVSKNLIGILDKVSEDDDSQVRLSSEIGKIAYYIWKFYSELFPAI